MKPTAYVKLLGNGARGIRFTKVESGVIPLYEIPKGYKIVPIELTQDISLKMVDVIKKNGVMDVSEHYKAMIEAAQDKTPGLHRYMPNAGLPDVRQAVAQTLSGEANVSLTANDLVMICGAAGGLNITLKTLLDPGDEVIVFAPYFVEYKFYADNHGGKAVAVKTKDDFSLDFSALEQGLGLNRFDAVSDDDFQVNFSNDIGLDMVDLWGVAGTISWDLGNFDVTSISSYRAVDQEVLSPGLP